MILDKHSPFNLIPAIISKEQAISFDLISLSCDFIDQSLKGLKDNLRLFSKESYTKTSPRKIFMYSWSFIDNSFRLYKALETLEIHEKGDLLIPLETIKPFRNTWQHIDSRVPIAVKKDLPILGKISWYYRDKERFQAIALNCGSLQRKISNTIAPHGYEKKRGVYHIQFESFNRPFEQITLDLDVLYSDIKKIIGHLENQLNQIIEKDVRMGLKLKSFPQLRIDLEWV